MPVLLSLRNHCHATLARLLVFEPSISTRSAFCVYAASSLSSRNLALETCQERQSAAEGFVASTGGASDVFKAGAARVAGLANTASSSLKVSSSSGNAKIHKESCVETLILVETHQVVGFKLRPN